MPRIHETAVIAETAVLGDGVEIGPYCSVGPEVTLGDGVRLVSHVNIAGRTRLGAQSVVYPFASLGTPPQDKSYRDEPTELVIGARTVVREHVTMNVGTPLGGGITRVGDGGYFMTASHVGHDCQVGGDVIFANNATLAGHVHVGDGVYIGGLTAVHQRVRIGSFAVVGGMTGVERDVIPYGACLGARAYLSGLNTVGLKRRGFSKPALHDLRALYREIFHGPGVLKDRVARLAEAEPQDAAARAVLDFLQAPSKRGIMTPFSGDGGAA